VLVMAKVDLVQIVDRRKSGQSPVVRLAMGEELKFACQTL
jgi:hypothetical protein